MVLHAQRGSVFHGCQRAIKGADFLEDEGSSMRMFQKSESNRGANYVGLYGYHCYLFLQSVTDGQL